MRKSLLSILVVALVFGLLSTYMGCKKDESPSNPNTNVPTYPVSAIVKGPSGTPQGGATLSLLNPPYASSIFSAITDSAGRGTIQAPAGAQTLLAKIGTVFQARISVNVAASQTGTNAGEITLQQDTSLGKVLVIFAGCETLEEVLRDTTIRFYNYDSTDVSNMRSQANTDSVALLNYLKRYSLIFSDCDCGSEDPYALLARVYGRYVQQGGKIYGGHYNWMNLYKIFAPYYRTSTNVSNDSLSIIDANLSTAVGYNVAHWPGYAFNAYQLWSDVPTGSSTVYAVITGTNPPVPLIVENRLGTGKYLWTVYHNQDILADPRLVRIVRYFLYSL